MTTAVGNRVRRSVRFAGLSETGGTGVQGVSSRRARMSEERLSSARFPNTQDWAGGVGVSPSGRFRVVEEPRKRTPLISAEGIRWDFARLLLTIAGAVMITVLLVMLASVGASSANIRQLDRKVSAVEKYNEELQGQVASHSGDISVCTEAVRLNLISSGGAQTIRLTAPEGAGLVLSGQDAAAENSGGNTGLRALAAGEE